MRAFARMLTPACRQATPPAAATEAKADAAGDSTVSLEDFVLIKVIGKGSFGKVSTHARAAARACVRARC